MEFIEQLKSVAARVEQNRSIIMTEESTKTSFILPFFQALGYDVFNPLEFTPECTADVGIKKGEKVDYAILQNGKPVILIEAKWCGEKLDSHGSQLFRYFGTTSARFGILTNGIEYRFYTDLDEKNKMDLVPFMEFNILNIKEEIIPELKKFHKLNLDLDNIFSSASELKYVTAIKQLLSKQLTAPDENFVLYILSEVYTGKKMQATVERFKDIVKRSYNIWVVNLLNEKFQTAMANTVSEAKENVEKTDDEQSEEIPKIITTAMELEGFAIIKAMLYGVIPPNDITFKDTESYFSILYKGNTRKWLCRLDLTGITKKMYLPDLETGKPVRYQINSANDLFSYKDQLLSIAKKYSSTTSA